MDMKLSVCGLIWLEGLMKTTKNVIQYDWAVCVHACMYKAILLCVLYVSKTWSLPLNDKQLTSF